MKHIIESIKSTLLYRSIYENPHYIFIIFSLICLLYYKYKIVGFIVSVIALLCTFILKITDNYSYSTLLKIYLVLFFAVTLFYKINFKTSINVDLILRWLLIANVAVLSLTTIDNPLLTIGLLITALLTPYFSVSKNKVDMTNPVGIPRAVDSYIILYSLVISYYQIQNKNFSEHLYLNLFAIIIPLLSHFINNRWAESRMLLLALLTIFDIFDSKNYGF